MQLRLGLAGEAGIPEVWATLGAAARGEVIERLAQAMVNAIGPQAAREVNNPVNTQSTKPTKTAKAAARTPRGSRDASSLSRRERSDDAGSVAGATEPARRSRSRGDTQARSGPQGGRAAKRTGKTRASSDASRGAGATKRTATRRTGYVCPPCGRFIATEVEGLALRVGRGSPPRFCSPGCRQAAYRRRQAGVAEDVRLQLGGGRDRSLTRAPPKAGRHRRRSNA